MMSRHATRTKKRSRAGASAGCPACGKKLRGDKGLIMHVEAEHPETYHAALQISPGNRLTNAQMATAIQTAMEAGKAVAS